MAYEQAEQARREEAEARREAAERDQQIIQLLERLSMRNHQ